MNRFAQNAHHFFLFSLRCKFKNLTKYNWASQKCHSDDVCLLQKIKSKGIHYRRLVVADESLNSPAHSQRRGSWGATFLLTVQFVHNFRLLSWCPILQLAAPDTTWSDSDTTASLVQGPESDAVIRHCAPLRKRQRCFTVLCPSPLIVISLGVC